MKAVTKILAAGAGVAALASAAPAAAQYYPGYGYGGGGGLEQIIGAILGQQRYGGYGYGYNPNQERALVEQCARATENRIQRSYASYNNGYGQYGYGGYGGYGGYNNYAAPARIVSINNLKRHSNGRITIYGTATSGRTQAYAQPYGGYGGYGGYGYNTAAAPDLRFDCTIDRYGRITDIDVERGRYNYRY